MVDGAGSWCPSLSRRQGISSHGIDQILPKYSSVWTIKVDIRDMYFLLSGPYDLWYQWEILNLADNTPNMKMPSEVTLAFDKLEDLILAWE